MKIDLLFNYKIRNIIGKNCKKRFFEEKRFCVVYPYIIFFKGERYENISIYDINELSIIRQYNNDILTNKEEINHVMLDCEIYKYNGNFVIFKGETFSKNYRIYMLSNITGALEIPTNKSWIVKKENKINNEEYEELFDDNKQQLFYSYFYGTSTPTMHNVLSYTNITKCSYVCKYGYYCKAVYDTMDDSLNILYFKFTE